MNANVHVINKFFTLRRSGTLDGESKKMKLHIMKVVSADMSRTID